MRCADILIFHLRWRIGRIRYGMDDLGTLLFREWGLGWAGNAICYLANVGRVEDMKVVG